MDSVQRAAERLVEYVADPSPAAQLARLNVPGRPIKGGHVGTGELRDYLYNRNVINKVRTELHQVCTVHLQQRAVLLPDLLAMHTQPVWVGQIWLGIVWLVLVWYG